MADFRVALETVDGTLALHNERIANIQADLTEKHKQNRNDIHDVRNVLQKLVDKVTRIETKLSFAAVISGAIVSIISILLEHYLGRH